MVNKKLVEKVYHGTNAKFGKFDERFKGNNTEYGNTIYGFFFTEKIATPVISEAVLLKRAFYVETSRFPFTWYTLSSLKFLYFNIDLIKFLFEIG